MELGPSDEVYFRPRHPTADHVSRPIPMQTQDESGTAAHLPAMGTSPPPSTGARLPLRRTLQAGIDLYRDREPAWREIGGSHLMACRRVEPPRVGSSSGGSSWSISRALVFANRVTQRVDSTEHL